LTNGDQNAIAEKIADVDQALKLMAKETDQFSLSDFERQLKSQLENCRYGPCTPRLLFK